MAEEYEARFTADDQITPAAKKAADAIDAIPETVDVTIDADATPLDRVLRAMDEVTAEAKITAEAAEALGRALGPELAAKADTTAIVTELRNAGVAIDDIKANADQLAAKLKEAADADVGGKLGSNLGTARGEIDKLSDSSRGANSALANMVGNSAQDIGQLTGVAGSAGVAIGQMAEYFADAKLGGEGLGSSLKSMAAVVGPIAALAAISSSLGSIFQAADARAERLAETVDQMGDAFRKGGDGALVIADSLRENSAGLRAFDADARTAFGGFVEGATAAANALPLIGAAIPDDAAQNITDVAAALTKAGISAYDLGRAFDAGGVDVTALRIQLELLAKNGTITSDQASAAAQAITEFGKAADKAKDSAGLFVVDQKEANAILDDLIAKKDPLAQMQDTWATLFADMADGSIDTKAAADAINQLADGLGITQAAVIGLAQGHLDDTMKDAAAATKEAADAAQAAKDRFVELADASGQIADVTSVFEEIGRRGDALKSIFDLGNAPVDAAAQVRDISGAIDELSETAKGVNVMDVIAGNTTADPLLDAIDQLRPAIQSRLVDTFSAGGPEAATAMANSYIDQVTQELGGKLSRDDVARLLGLENIEAVVGVAVDQSALARAKSELDVLVGVGGQTPFTASLQLAVDSGQISGEAARAIVESGLEEQGVKVPLDPVTDPSALEESRAFMRSFIEANPPTVQIGGDATGVTDAASDAAKAVAGTTADVTVGADTTEADKGVAAVKTTAEGTKAKVPVSSDTVAAIRDIVLIYVIAQALKPVISVGANTSSAETAIGAAVRPRTATLNVETTGVAAAQSTLNSLTQPRSVTIRPVVSPTSVLVRVDGG